MDRLYRIRHMTSDAAYTAGDCDVCYQRGVKVKPLRCGRHHYCRMCAEFVPRLLRGDSTCMACSDTCHRQEALDTDHLDKFLSDQTGSGTGYSDVAVNLGGEKIMSFQGDPEEAEFDGNNEEWDALLRSMPEPRRNPHGPPRPALVQTADGTREYYAETATREPPGIPRKVSRLRLALPSDDTAAPEYDGASSKQPISNNVTELIHASNYKQPVSNNVTELIHASNYQTLPPYIPRKKQDDSTGSSSDSYSSSGSSGSLKELVAPPRREIMINSPSGDSFDSDPSELERCSSPVKVPRRTLEFLRRHRRKLSPEEAELAAMAEEIGDIEGPRDSSSGGSDGSRSARVDDRDAFWEF